MEWGSCNCLKNSYWHTIDRLIVMHQEKKSQATLKKKKTKKKQTRCARVRQDLGQAGADFFCFQLRISQVLNLDAVLVFFSFFSPYGFFFIVSVQLRIKKRRWLMALHWYATFELKFKYLLCGYSTCFILVFGVLFWASVFISLRFYIKVGWYNKLLNSKTLISVSLVHEKVMSFYLLFINK